MPFITYPQDNGQVAVIIPAEGATKSVTLTEEIPLLDEEGTPTGEVNTVERVEYVPMSIEEIAAKDVPAGLPYKIVESLDIESDYFDAYEFDGNTGAVVNIAKAKAIHLDKFRAARTPKLQALDVAYSRADESGDVAKKAEIAVQKQALRDVTKIELPNDLAAIKNTWPEILT
jgi:hypothetical protein